MNCRMVGFFIWFGAGFFPAAAQAPLDSVLADLDFAFGRQGDAAGEFLQPMAIAIDPNGNLYVADTGNNRVQRFNAWGQFQGMVGGFGWAQEQFQRPLDVCADNGLDVFVADHDNRRIERFDKELHWIGTMSADPYSDEKLTMGFVTGIGLSRHGDLFVADAEYRRVLKFNTQQQAEISFGDFNWGAGDLLAPTQLIVEKDDRIYVVDCGAGGVLVYDYFGNYLLTIGKGVLLEPAGIGSIASRGLVMVSDIQRDQVLIFNQVGRWMGTVGVAGEKLGALDQPADVAFYNDRIYVVESGQHRVQVFKLRLESHP